MYKGELKERGTRYASGHNTGIVRAYDDLIMAFGQKFPKAAKELDFIRQRKHEFLDYCIEFGMNDEDHDEEFISSTRKRRIDYLNRVSRILSMKVVCEDAELNYQVFRNSKANNFERVSDDTLEYWCDRIIAEVEKNSLY